MRLLILSLLLCNSCGVFIRHKKSAEVIIEDYDLLKNKRELFAKKSVEKTKDRFGWFDYDCDALLFTSLVADKQELKIDLMDAYDGQIWHRRPDFMPECYPDHSKSSISRDMLLGVIWYAWRTKNLDIIQDLIDYGVKNLWVMGKGLKSRTALTPQFISTITMIRDKLKGQTKLQSYIPLILSTKLRGYQANLGVMHALLRAEVQGYAPDYYLDFFISQAARAPKNALFLYSRDIYKNGDMTNATKIMLSNEYYPNDGTLDNTVHCEPWLWQRDFGDSWIPCDEERIHSGYDFIFVADLILNEFGR